MNHPLHVHNSKNPRFVNKLVVSLQHPCWVRLFQAVGICAIMVVVSKWGSSLQEWREIIISENGPVERMSAAVWFMSSVWCLRMTWSSQARRIEWLALTTLFLLFGLRELDAHRWSTGWNLDALANYWNPQFPLGERIFIIMVAIVPCMIVAGMLWSRFWRTCLVNFAIGADWVGSLLLGLFLLLVCLILDKVGAYYLPLIHIGENGKWLVAEAEELLECVLAVYATAILWPFWVAELEQSRR